MANWTEITDEIKKSSNPLILEELLVRELASIRKLCGNKNVVYYASGFLQKPARPQTSITREDINGFMNAIHGLNCAEGLVLMVHTPGGDIHAVESIVEYLHQKFEHITAIIPYLAMSGGSMISLASDLIILGKQSQLGPTDPQIVIQDKQHSARAIKDAFDRAKEDIEKNQTLAHLWAPILQSMGPALIIEAEKALKYSESLLKKWLQKRMFRSADETDEKAKEIVEYVNADSEEVHTHGQRIGIDDLQVLGANVEALENNQDLQEAVLSAYHLMTIIFERTPSLKFIANHAGKMWSKNMPPEINVPQAFIQAPPSVPPQNKQQRSTFKPAQRRKRK